MLSNLKTHYKATTTYVPLMSEPGPHCSEFFHYCHSGPCSNRHTPLILHSSANLISFYTLWK